MLILFSCFHLLITWKNDKAEIDMSNGISDGQTRLFANATCWFVSCSVHTTQYNNCQYNGELS